jgi:hypothetical protein
LAGGLDAVMPEGDLDAPEGGAGAKDRVGEGKARAFLHDLHERLRAFELALHPDKTRLIRFGRQAAEQRASLGEGNPETFEFLGFTHFCTRSRTWGTFVIGRKTIKGGTGRSSRPSRWSCASVCTTPSRRPESG